MNDLHKLIRCNTPALLSVSLMFVAISQYKRASLANSCGILISQKYKLTDSVTNPIEETNAICDIGRYKSLYESG